MKVNKDILISKIYGSIDGFSKDDIKIAVDEMLDLIKEALLEKYRVEIRGFGSFAIRTRLVPQDPRKNMIENTERVIRNSIYFRPTKKLHEKLKIS